MKRHGQIMVKVIGGLLVVVMLCLGGLSLSPTGAVRVNLMTSGHPILASTVRITKNDYQKNRTPWTKRGDYLINHPIVTETGAKIDEFSIQQHGIFYTATQNYRASFWALGSQQGLSNSWLLPQLADRNGTGPSLRGGLESRL